MKKTIKTTPSRPGVARALLNYLIAVALPLALPGVISAQTLQHRYSFATDATDSVGGANGTSVPGNNAAIISNGLMLPCRARGLPALHQVMWLCPMGSFKATPR
jgi:hypothetical protein